MCCETDQAGRYTKGAKAFPQNKTGSIRNSFNVKGSHSLFRALTCCCNDSIGSKRLYIKWQLNEAPACVPLMDYLKTEEYASSACLAAS